MLETRPARWVRSAQIYPLDLPDSKPSICPDLQYRSGQVYNMLNNELRNIRKQ